MVPGPPTSARPSPHPAWTLFALLGFAALAAGPRPAVAQLTLAGAAEVSGRYFGTAVSQQKLGDPAYTGLAAREFDMVTPENELKLDATEPRQNQFNFTAGDRIYDWATAQGMRVRGHTLVWHSAPPAWFSSLGPAAVRAAMLNHVTQVVAHYKGKLYAWDVVNEAFLEDGSRRRSLFQYTGDDYIEAAFRAARAADPSVQLCYNDYNIEDATYPKTVAVLDMIRDFKARGVPIDCVGIQGHFTGGHKLPASLQTTLERFAALGVDVALTEVDVTNADAATYRALTTACMNVPRCVGITVWGVRDNDSWRSSERPLLFDASANPKPAYTAVLEALGGPCCAPSYRLTVTASGTGHGSIQATHAQGGGQCAFLSPTTCSFTIPAGLPVTLTATPASGSVFAGWTGPCTGTGACVLTMTADQAVGAVLTVPIPDRTLTIVKVGTGSGSVTVSPACGSPCTFKDGTVVTITAAPDAGSTYDGMTVDFGAGAEGDFSGCTASYCMGTLRRDATATVTFTRTAPAAPCPNPVTFTGNSGSFGTTGPVCLRTAMSVRGWGCSSFEGRTVSVNGGAATSTCGTGPSPIPSWSDGYTYFSISGGRYTWGTLYAWTW